MEALKEDVTSKDYSILVTGATGFIGKKLVDALCRQGSRVRVISRKGFEARDSLLEIFEGDLLADDFPFDEALKDCSVLFHCAGEPHPQEFNLANIKSFQRG